MGLGGGQRRGKLACGALGCRAGCRNRHHAWRPGWQRTASGSERELCSAVRDRRSGCCCVRRRSRRSVTVLLRATVCQLSFSPGWRVCRELFLAMEYGCTDPVDPEPLAKALQLGELGAWGDMQPAGFALRATAHGRHHNWCRSAVGLRAARAGPPPPLWPPPPACSHPCVPPAVLCCAVPRACRPCSAAGRSGVHEALLVAAGGAI